MGKKKAIIGIVLVIVVVLLCACGGLAYFGYNKYFKNKVSESLTESIIEGAIESETGSDVDIDLGSDGDEGSFHIED
ncbi:MAG: hypothetical protein U9Q67_04175, partial [Patescibacteria group bacterium]|nr:hypothetical protein [Patescibacteria group bacterium]